MKPVLFFILYCLFLTKSFSNSDLPSQKIISQLPKDGGKKYNRLIFEKSPYLLQYSKDPINWFAWTDEAFKKAKKENKPIFLSIGHLNSHWCNVMKKDSFESQEVAKVLNEKYIAIKVDKKEKPEIDSFYMKATQIITQGNSGWPNSLWLTPDKEAFYANTFTPKKDFIQLLNDLSKAYKTNFKEIQNQANKISQLLKKQTNSQKWTPKKAYAQKDPVTLNAHFKNNKVYIQVDIEDHWHINSNEPLQDYLIPTSIINNSKDVIQLKSFEYPESQIMEMEFADEEIDIFEESFQLVIPIKFIKKPQSFELIFSTQACSDEECLSPEKLSLKF